MPQSKPDEPIRADRRRWIVLVVLCTGQLMIVLDATVVNVALPAIQVELHFTQSSLAWVVNAYLLTFGGLLLLAGRVGDLVGRSRVFLSGLALFSVASVACGVAPDASVLVGARFAQGASAALIASMVLGIISPMFATGRERTTALSVFAFVAIGGGTLGLVLGGVLTTALSWHWIFFINVPVGAAAWVVGRRLLPADQGLGIDQGADLLGAALVTAAPMLAVLGLVDAGSDGWASPSTLAPLAAAVLVGTAFVVAEGRVRTPLIPLGIFKHRNLSSATVVRMLFPMGGFGFNFVGVLYLQHILGYTPLQTGLAFLPGSVLTGVVSLAVTPRLIRRCGPKPLVVTGLILVTSGLAAFTPVPVHGDFVANVLPTMVLTGVGFGLVFMPSVSIAMSDTDASEAGLASGLANVSPQLGASIGVAAMATVAAARTRSLSVGGHPSASALVGGYRAAMVVAVCLCGSGLLAAALLLRPTAAHEPSAAPLLPD